jgi:hypothetical protein
MFTQSSNPTIGQVYLKTNQLGFKPYGFFRKITLLNVFRCSFPVQFNTLSQRIAQLIMIFPKFLSTGIKES